MSSLTNDLQTYAVTPVVSVVVAIEIGMFIYLMYYIKAAKISILNEHKQITLSGLMIVAQCISLFFAPLQGLFIVLYIWVGKLSPFLCATLTPASSVSRMMSNSFTYFYFWFRVMLVGENQLKWKYLSLYSAVDIGLMILNVGTFIFALMPAFVAQGRINASGNCLPNIPTWIPTGVVICTIVFSCIYLVLFRKPIVEIIDRFRGRQLRSVDAVNEALLRATKACIIVCISSLILITPAIVTSATTQFEWLNATRHMFTATDLMINAGALLYCLAPLKKEEKAQVLSSSTSV